MFTKGTGSWLTCRVFTHFQWVGPASLGFSLFLVATIVVPITRLHATPANRAAFNAHYERFLSPNLNQCSTCHLPGDHQDPQTLEEFPHNAFGHRLKILGDELKSTGTRPDLESRLNLVADEDSDGDGVDNQTEILLGFHPGHSKSVPTKVELESLKEKQSEFSKFQNAYRWRPFNSVQRPDVPTVVDKAWPANPIDHFIAAKHKEHGLQPRDEAPRETLLRRVYLDLIGLPPTPDEQDEFISDQSDQAYEKIVERLLEDPRHGERWGRHWMDVWRYSDWAGWTDGNQVRDSQRHIWRWRDWIVESLNADKGYDRMLVDMLAADEQTPLDTNALRATGFLVRNYKMLSREQWMEDTIKHTSQAFLGVTMGCAKCHDHMTDPISQADYYRMRAIFDPHQVRTDRVPGEIDRTRDGLVRVFDTLTNNLTPILIRGDERYPDTNRLMTAGVPVALCGDTSLAASQGDLKSQTIALPFPSTQPDRRDFVRHDLLAVSQAEVEKARKTLAHLSDEKTPAEGQLTESQLNLELAEAKYASLSAVLRVEEIEDAGKKDSEQWIEAAKEANQRQRMVARAEARLDRHNVQSEVHVLQAKLDKWIAAHSGAPEESPEETSELKAIRGQMDKTRNDLEKLEQKLSEANERLAKADLELESEPSIEFKRRSMDSYPGESTGRRLAFARWLVDPKNPLTARVAMNHVWLRHFGRGLVPTPADFGRNGRPPSHPELLDWLAAEFMSRQWSFKEMHRLMVTSRTYRMASTPDERNASFDPDNVFLWRMSSRRLEAEAVRDGLFYAAGNLDLTMGGPEIDHKLGLESRRRSLYLRLAAEKEVEFLRIFDGPMVTECYERRSSVMPQQALALVNSSLVQREAAQLAERLTDVYGNDDQGFIREAYQRVLARLPEQEEIGLCTEFLGLPASETRALDSDSSLLDRRRNLVLVLFNHNDFVTVR